MREQWCCGGPAAEMGYADRAREFAQHNVDDWRAVGARRIIVFDPHDYISFTEDYPATSAMTTTSRSCSSSTSSPS